MAKCSVVARDRTVFVDGDMTLRDVAKYLDSIGQIFSLRRTLQLYGLQYVEKRSFVSKYKGYFGLDKRDMFDITVNELDNYKKHLLGMPVIYGNRLTSKHD